MENISRLISLLIVIQNFSKDIHYNAKGEAFYSKHLLVDRVQENISDYIDSLKEVCFLGSDKEPLSSKEYLTDAAQVIPAIVDEDKTNFISLSSLLILTLQHIEGLEGLSKGEENLIGNIAENLQTSLGLVLRQIK